MYSLQFTLKQHTPLIHFQHHQAGATLRASEVKPKLDRFILMKLGKEASPELTDYEQIYKNGFDVAKKNKWLVGDGTHPALDYKMRIDIIDSKANNYYYFESRIRDDLKIKIENKIKEELKLPNLTLVAPAPYFANNDKRSHGEYNKMRIGVINSGNILLEVQTKSSEIKDLIKKHFSRFISIDNFGARQSKGFGSFTENDCKLNSYREILCSHYKFCKAITNKPLNSINDVFDKIDNFYRKLKNKVPNESKIKEYFLEQGIEWEKDFISKTVAQSKEYKTNNDIKYIRALLGLADIYDYQQIDIKVKICDVQNDELKRIERFKSPITFKVLDKNIFIVSNVTDIKQILNKEFIFYVGEKPEEAIRSQKIKTPLTFDFVDFLNQNI